jgi:hypothetical protein
MKKSLFLACLCVLLSNTLYASEALYEQHMAKGVVEIERGNFPKAAAEFREALKEKPEDPAATLYLGIALSRTGDKEAEASLNRALALSPEDPRTNLELGIYYFRLDQRDESTEYFEKTIRLAPGTELSDKASEYLNAKKEKKAGKRWSLGVTAGGQYDTNVVLTPDGASLPQGISQKSDWRGIALLRGRYAIPGERTEGSIGYSFYQSFHSRLSDFDLTQHLLDLSGEVRISPSLQLKGIYLFEYIALGGDQYEYAHAVGPAITIHEAKGFSTVFEYRYKRLYYNDTDRFPSNTDRDGSNHSGGITQNLRLADTLLVNLGYSHDVDSARQNFWDANGDKGFIGARVNLPYRIVFGGYAEYYRKNFGGVDPSAGVKRKDITRTYSASAGISITDWFSIMLGQSYIENTSTVPDLAYKRGISSLFLNARF